MRTYTLILTLISLFSGCNSADPKLASTSNVRCSFTLSGAISGQFGSRINTDEHSSYLWFNCAGPIPEADDNEVTVGIKRSSFDSIGVGTYDLAGGTDGKIMVKSEASKKFSSYPSSGLCEADFNSSNHLTFSCVDLQEVDDEGNVVDDGEILSVSNGHFSL